MHRLFALLLTLLPFSLAAQTVPDKTAALKQAVYILTIAGERSGLDGPFYRFRGDVTSTKDSMEFIAAKNITAPEGVSRQLLFRSGKNWPAFAAELTAEGAQAMRAAITEVLPAEKPTGHFSSRTQSTATVDTYVIVENGTAIGSLSIKKNSGVGTLVMKPGY